MLKITSEISLSGFAAKRHHFLPHPNFTYPRGAFQILRAALAWRHAQSVAQNVCYGKQLL